MKNDSLNVVCVASIHDINTWYIFRANEIEVKIEMVNGTFKTSKVLTDLEIEYLENNLR